MPDLNATKPAQRAGLLLAIVYLGYINLGLPDGTLGVAWPAIYPDLDLPIGLAGTILTLGTLLTAVAGFSSGWILARWRTGPVMLVSVILTATGLLLLAAAQGAFWLYVAAVPLGLGAGAVDAGLNAFVARHYAARHMNWLHACWGVGATTGPLLFGLMLGTAAGWRGGYFVLGGLQMCMALFFLLTLGLWTATPARTEEETPAASRSVPTLGANSFAGWLSSFLFALYVAVEMTTGLWAGTVMVVQRGFAPETAAWCVAGYYAAITLGRLAVGFIADRSGNRLLVTGGAVVALAGLTGFAWTDGRWTCAAALVLAGLGLAPIYPGLMHEVPARFAPSAVPTVIGRQSGGASLGAAVLPAVAGALAAGSLGAVPWLVVVVLAVLLGGIRVLDRLT